MMRRYEIIRLLFLIFLLSACLDVYAQPSINFGYSGNAAGCAPHTVNFNISNFAGNDASTTYALNFGDGSPVVNFTQGTLPTTVSHTYTQISCGQSFNGNQNAFGATITATNASGSTIGTVTPIRISKKPNAAFTMSPSVICSGGSITFTNTSDPGVTYSGNTCNTNPPFYWTVTGPSAGMVSTGSTGSNGGFPTNINGWATGSSPLTMQFNTPGSYQMKLAIGNSCGIDDTTLSFCVVAPPAPQFVLSSTCGFAPPNFSISADNNTALNPSSCYNTAYSYNWSISPASGWSFSAGNSATGYDTGITFSSPPNSSPPNYTITLTASVNGLNSCSSSTSQTVQVLSPPSAGSNQTVCAGSQPIPLNGMPSGGNWQINQPVIGSISQNAGTFFYTPPSSVSNTTQVTLTYTIPASGACPAASSQLVITVNPLPVINFTIPSPEFCAGASVNLTASATVSGNQVPASFTWAPAAGLNSTTGATVTASPASTTIYTATGTVTATGCSNTGTVTVTVNPYPSVSINPSPVLLCAGQCVTLNSNITNSTSSIGPYSYSWNPSAGLSVNNAASVQACPNTSTTYTVTVTDAQGCTGQQTVLVNVSSSNGANAGDNASVCAGASPIQLNGSPSGGTWQINPPIIGSISQIGATYFFTPPNTVASATSVTLTYTSPANGPCAGGSDQVVITINPRPTINVTSPPQPICAGTSVNLTASANVLGSQVPASFTWSPATGLNDANLATVIASPATTTTYTVSGTVIATGCSSTGTVTVPVNPNPTINVAPATICAGASVNLAASATVSGNQVPASFTWSPATGLNTATGATVIASPSTTTTYTVSGTVTATGCSGTNTVMVNVTPLPNTTTDTISICNTPNPYTLPSLGTWANGNTYTPVDTGYFSLSYTVMQNNCTATGTLVLHVIDPTPADAGLPDTLCLNSAPVTLIGSPTPGTWSGNGVSGNSFTPATVGTFTLTYSFGQGNCAVTDTKTITVVHLPIASVSDTTICAGQCATLTPQNISSGNTYSWSPSAGLSASNIAIVSACSTGTATYILTVTDANGCISSDQSIVTVTPLPLLGDNPDTLAICNTTIPYTLPLFEPQGGVWVGGNTYTPIDTGYFSFTYSVTQNNCSISDPLILLVIDPTPADAGLPDTLCLNAPPLNLSATPTGGSWSGNGVSANTFLPTTVGAFTLTYSFGDGNCAVSDTKQITVLELPTVQASDVEYCTGSNAILQSIVSGGVAPYTYTWSPPNGLSSTTNASVTIDTALAVSTFGPLLASYTVTVSDAFSCTAQQQVVATVKPLPIVNAGPDSVICFTTIPINLVAVEPPNGTWSGLGVSGNSYVPSTEGQDTLVYTYTESNTGCINVDSIIVTANNPDEVNAGNDTSVCINYDPFVFGAQSPAGGNWSGSSQVDEDGVFTADIAGSVTLYYTTGTGNCAVTDSLVVLVNSLPVVEAGADTSICVNSPPFIFSGESPIANGTWAWSGAGISNAQLGIFDADISGGGVFTSYYTFTETATGCSNLDSLVVTVNELTPVAVMDSLMDDSLSVCLTPFNTLLTATPAGGIWTGTNINFDFNLAGAQDTAGFIPQNNGWFSASYTYTDANQCVNADTLHIEVVSPVDADAGPDVSFCFSASDTAQLNGLPANGSWTDIQNPSWLLSDGNLVLAQADTFMAVFTVGTGSCQTWDTTDVVIFPLPELEAGVDTFRCIDDPCFDLIPVFPVGGLWSGIGITNGPAGTFCSQTALEGNHVIYYDIDTTYFYQSLSSTCLNRDSLNVLVVPMPSPDLVIESVLCVDVDDTLENNSIGPSAEFEWTILNATNLDTIWFSTDFSPVINLSEPGSYLLRLNAISPYGCSVETETDFIVVTPPVPQFTLSEDTACAPYQVGINNTSSGYQISYEWDFGLLFPLSFDENPALPTFPSPVLADSLYFVQLSLTNLCGTRTVMDSVVVRPQPVAVLGTDYSQACSPATFMLQNASYGSPSSYQWDFGNGTTSTDSLPASVFYTAQTITASYLIQLTVSNSCGINIDSTEVFILPSDIELNALLPQTACAPFTLSFTSPLANQSYYLWDFGDGNGGIGESISHTYTTPGTYTLELFVSNFCFTDSATTVITINEGPQLSMNVSESLICQNSEVTATNTSVNGAGYQWLFNNQLQSGNANVQTFVLNQGGANSIQLTGLNPQNGCRDTIETSVEAVPFPIMDISVTPDTGCYPLQATFLNQTTGANAWEWSFEDGTGSSVQEPVLIIESLGAFNAQLIAHNYVSFELDCPDTANVSVWVHPSPVSSFSLSAVDGCGPPAEVNTINQSQSAVSYEWRWENNMSNEMAPSLAFSDTGLKVISLKVLNVLGCPDSSLAEYKVFGQPVIDFDVLPASGCPPLEVEFANQTQYADSVSWGFGDGNFAEGYSSSHIYENTGFYPLQVYMSTGNGRCWADSMIAEAIEVYPRAVSDFTVTPPVVSEGIPTFTFDNSSSGFNALELYFDTLYLVDELPVMFTLAEPDTGTHYFMLLANNEYNCPDTSYQQVYVKPEPTFFMPNSFSPNGDGKNDKFRIYFEKAPEVFWVNIYNRWGQLIFTSTDPEEEWDGTFMNRGGKKVENEVYVLKFSAIIEGTVVNSRLFYNVTVIH